MTLPSRSAKLLNPFESRLLREKAFDLIKAKSFTKGRFKLASGKESDYYLDMKTTMFNPAGAHALAEMILYRLQRIEIDHVGGLALGALPLISNITMLSHDRNCPIAGFFVRKDVKDHGTMKLVEGLAAGETLQGKQVVILEDVTTTGGSAMVAVRAAQASGAKVVLVLSIVDREEGAAAFYKDLGIAFEALFTASDFLKS